MYIIVHRSRYYNDLFVFDIEKVMWNEVSMGVGALKPGKPTSQSAVACDEWLYYGSTVLP